MYDIFLGTAFSTLESYVGTYSAYVLGIRLAGCLVARYPGAPEAVGNLTPVLIRRLLDVLQMLIAIQRSRIMISVH
jgi:hypothetical protein